ncbi:uncharacterized protein LOC116305687 [Actinia tenebrosa]|uniref:Uncharacterized protein LOC116305687 n=1 Tax=Actinia tenebrosa TaxID=6105 RepID=A0A6P8IWL1_ACTTE|nr:uncharacterized protein LOC116305687 [Actinia tenebrosa]
MKIILVSCLLLALAIAEEDVHMNEELLEQVPQEEDSVKRGFSSYYRNYYDEIAMSVCASMPMRGGGYIFPVRRACSSTNKQTCSQLCASAGVRKQLTAGSSSYIFECLESLHIYKGRPQLAANPGGNTDVGRIGLIVYRYHSCSGSSCGPNYCCCRKGHQ